MYINNKVKNNYILLYIYFIKKIFTNKTKYLCIKIFKKVFYFKKIHTHKFFEEKN